MKKVVMTAACLALSGMLTASMAGDCKKGKKKSCGGGEGDCGGKKTTLTMQADDFIVDCGGKKGKCGDDKDTDS